MIIHVNGVYMLLGYIFALISTIIVGVLLKLPILPEKPMRHSWRISIIFPTVVIAIGTVAIVAEFGYSGAVVGVVVGILSALFSKLLLEKVFPKPAAEESHE